MKHYKIKIGYTIEFNIDAENEKEAEEWLGFSLINQRLTNQK